MIDMNCVFQMHHLITIELALEWEYTFYAHTEKSCKKAWAFVLCIHDGLWSMHRINTKFMTYIHILFARLFVYLYVVSVFRLFYFFAEHQHITHTWFLTHSQSVLLTVSAHVHTTCMQQHGNKPFHNTISNSKGVYFSLLVAQSKPKWHMYICMKLQQQQQQHQKNNRRFKSFNWRATSLSIPCAFLQRCCLWYSTIQLCVYYTYN